MFTSVANIVIIKEKGGNMMQQNMIVNTMIKSRGKEKRNGIKEKERVVIHTTVKIYLRVTH